jgi:hypothetical protein
LATQILRICFDLYTGVIKKAVYPNNATERRIQGCRKESKRNPWGQKYANPKILKKILSKFFKN